MGQAYEGEREYVVHQEIQEIRDKWAKHESGEAPLKEMDDLTHTIEITIHGNYPHGVKQHSSVSISGDGGIDHMIDAFKAALIAAGFTAKTVQRIFVEDRGDGPDQDGAGTESG